MVLDLIAGARLNLVGHRRRSVPFKDPIEIEQEGKEREKKKTLETILNNGL